MNYCTDCGGENKATAKFCTSCGNQMNPSVVVEQPTGNHKEANQQTTSQETDLVKRTSEMVSSIDTSTIQEYFFNYVNFQKATLLRPSMAFEQTNWVNAVISIILFASLQALISQDGFFTSAILYTGMQGVFVGALFVISQFIIQSKESIVEIVSHYGGLINSQIILLAFILIAGMNSFMGVLLVMLLLLNQMNIFNLYIFNSQKAGKGKLDSYYEVLVSYVALIITLYLMFNGLS